MRVSVSLGVALHVVALMISGQSAVSSPINELAQSPTSLLLGLSVFAFAVAQMAFRFHLLRSGRLSFQRTIENLCVAAGVILIALPVFLIPGEDRYAAVALSALATVVASIMSLLIPALRHRSRRIPGLNLHGLNLIVLALWIVLIPVGLSLGPGVEGAYQRSVGVLYAIWLFSLSFMMPTSDDSKT